MTPAEPTRLAPYGIYFVTTFSIDGRRDSPVALLWARENGFWKIVSWRVGVDDATSPGTRADCGFQGRPHQCRYETRSSGARISESWLVRKDYDAAFVYLSPRSYACYDLERGADEAPSSSPEDAGRKLRASLAASGKTAGTARNLQALLAPAEPFHPAVRVMNHPYSSVFSLTSPPNAVADASECAARVGGSRAPDPVPLEYGNGFGMNVRFKTPNGDAPVLRLLWRRENGAWRVSSYVVELP